MTVVILIKFSVWSTLSGRQLQLYNANVMCFGEGALTRAAPGILVTGYQTFAMRKFKSGGYRGKIFRKIV